MSRVDIVAPVLNRYQMMKAQLLEMCPDLADDEEALLDTLDGESDLPEVLTRLARAAVYRETQAKAMKDLLERYTGRKKAHERAAFVLREAVKAAMVDAKRKNLKVADVTLSVKELPNKIEIAPGIDVEMLPDEYIRETVVKSIDMEKVETAIENGVDLDFVIIHIDRHSLTIRV